jgi:DNA mismatch repair ATPase MutS
LNCDFNKFLILEAWLKQPLCDLARISQRHDIVEAFNEACECRDALHRNYLRKVHDVVPLSKTLKKGKAKLDTCYKLYRSICALGLMIEQLGDVEACVAAQELILVRFKNVLQI